MSEPKLAEGLEAGECRIKLTKSERELLHHVLAVARENAPLFGASSEGERNMAGYFHMVVDRIQKKLPPRGSGTY